MYINEYRKKIKDITAWLNKNSDLIHPLLLDQSSKSKSGQNYFIQFFNSFIKLRKEFEQAVKRR